MKFNIFKKKKAEEEQKEEEELKKIMSETKKESVGEIIDRYNKKPSLIFVGSSKGGVGKSFISGTLSVVISALSMNKVYAVDLDLDNYTLSQILPPPNAWNDFIRKLNNSNIEYMNIADIIKEGAIKPGTWRVPKFADYTMSCLSQKVKYEFVLIPAYHKLRDRDQQAYLVRDVSSSILNSAMNTLVGEYFLKKKEQQENFVVIFDGKQKSNIGIEYEPIYKTLLSYSDLFILITEAPYLSFNSVTAPYRDFMDKMIIVVNKVAIQHIDPVMIFIRDALASKIPVFLIPEDNQDNKLYTANKIIPASKSLSSKTTLFVMALARYLNLVDDTLLKEYGCKQDVDKINMYHKKLYEYLTNTNNQTKS